MSKEAIFETLTALHQAQEAHGLDAMIAAYADQGVVQKEQMRSYFEGMIEQGLFKDRTIDFSHSETFVWRNRALIKPVIYETAVGLRSFSFNFAEQDDGKWLIIDNRRSWLPGENIYTDEMIAHAGRIVRSRGMLWTRYLSVPVEEAWEAISTSEGISKWWLNRQGEIDLKPGGLFKHHWNNRIKDFKENEYITFVEDPGKSGANSYMRFDLEPDGDGTLFHFYDAFHGVNMALTIPWTCSGWHGTVDALETTLTGRQISSDFGLGGEFYWKYMRNYHRYPTMTDFLPPGHFTDDEWREAYQTEAV